MLPNATYGHADDERSLENPGADTVIPIFYMEKSLNKKKSEAAQRAIFDEYEAARFIIPGDNTFEHRERVTDEDIRRWPARYAAFKAGMEQIDGMPLDTWYKLIPHPGLIEEMKALKIRSVEDLARLSDDTAARTNWGMEWRKLAKVEVDARVNKDALAEANAGLIAKLEGETAAREKMELRLAEMEKALAAAATGIAAQPAKSKGGRPAGSKNKAQGAAA